LKSEDPINALYMDKELAKLQTSIIVRVHDNQTFIIPEKNDYNDLNTDYLLGKDLQKYFFNEEENEKSLSETIKQITKSINQEDHLKAVKDSLRLDYGFVYPKI
jgi:inorganic pyrophosphatase/exopolyphosphatase